MNRSVEFTNHPIDESALLTARKTGPEIGAAVYFTGIVRGMESGQPIAALDYEAFEPMARRQFDLLFDEIERRWPIHSMRVVHRTGPVAVGEVSFWLETTAAHRAEAFAAAQYLIDEMKHRVPIWKQPVPRTPDGPG